MFKKNFVKLCNLHGKAPTMVLLDLGLSKSTFSNWTDESVPRESTLQRIADYFDITVEELLADEPATSVRVNNGIIGNRNSNNVVSVGAARSDLSEIEIELLSLCKQMTIQQKNNLLTYAYEIVNRK